MVHEIILAIDPALQKVEEILLWKNRVKTSIIFTACNISMWLLYSFNIRTYCTISCIALLFHLLDAYRNQIKKKIRINRIQVQSSIGKYIINAYDSGTSFLQRCLKLKRQNPVKYFLVMLLFWILLAIFGTKVKGFYISYAIFWVLFFVPAILHYEVPRLLLNKATPLLEQLDRSMKYERRSILDKKELLVDVKLPQTSLENDDLAEDEYLNEFRFDKKVTTKKLSVENDLSNSSSENVDEVVDEGEDSLTGSDEEDEVDEAGEVEQNEEIIREKLKNSFKNQNVNNNNDGDVEDDDDDDEFIFKNENIKNIGINNKIKFKKPKNRPSLFDSYLTTTSEKIDPITHEKIIEKTSVHKEIIFDNDPKSIFSSVLTNTANAVLNQFAQSSQNDKDIDDTFDFLDKELNQFEEKD